MHTKLELQRQASQDEHDLYRVLAKFFAQKCHESQYLRESDLRLNIDSGTIEMNKQGALCKENLRPAAASLKIAQIRQRNSASTKMPWSRSHADNINLEATQMRARLVQAKERIRS